MYRSKRGAAFYVETILLILFLLFSLTVLVRILGTAKQFSLEARQLSCAVRIAQDAAEQAAVCDSPEALAALLDAQETEDGVLTKLYDAQGMPVPGNAAISGSTAAGGTSNGAADRADTGGTDANRAAEGGADANRAAEGGADANRAAEDGADANRAAVSDTGAVYSLLCRVDTAAQGSGVLLTVHFTVCNEHGILYELETQKYIRG